MAEMDSLRELYVEELKDLWSAENQILKGLPRMIKAATHPQLGAISPAYASLEMLQGAEPDPRDDIYALACVTYELLTGHHPFNRIDAAKAAAQRLQPAPVRGLSRAQWHGLRRGLAFDQPDDVIGSIGNVETTVIQRNPTRKV